MWVYAWKEEKAEKKRKLPTLPATAPRAFRDRQPFGRRPGQRHPFVLFALFVFFVVPLTA
jgi:hypothetical protein